MAKEERLENILYYLVEKTNKVVRRYSQEKFYQAGLNITIDQWLVMKKINDSQQISQVELAEALFKDTASITRILSLLIKKKLVKKDVAEDKRAYHLSLTPGGKDFIDKAIKVVNDLRKQGIKGMSDSEVNNLKKSLQKMIDNMS